MKSNIIRKAERKTHSEPDRKSGRKIEIGKKIVLAGALCIAILLIPAESVKAREATSYTYTQSDDGWELIQDVYKPTRGLLQDAGLNSPEDIFYYDGCLYVADSGNGRILCCDLDTFSVEEIGAGSFVTPTGIYVNELGIFVADRGLARACWMDFTGNIIRNYEKPQQYSYGRNTVYLPSKIVADSKANVYILSAGTYQGLVQFDDKGEFVGFYAANDTSITVSQWLMNLFFTEAQKEKLFNITPTSFNDITIHPEENLIFSLTPESTSVIKEHSVAGGNILSGYSKGEKKYEAMDLGANQEIFTVTTSGIVYVYSSMGEFLFSFGGQAVAEDLAGYATVVSAIAVDEDNCVYLLDRQRGMVHTYLPTDFARYIFRALELFEKGEFADSSRYWQQVLKLSPDFQLAYNTMAAASMQQGEYRQALTYYRRGENKTGYSEAKWELRNRWINEYFAVCLIGCIILYFVTKTLKIIFHRLGIGGNIKASLEKRKNECQEIAQIWYTIRHPIDTFFYIKREQRCSVEGALALYLASLAVFIWDQAGKGYLFNHTDIMNTSPLYFIGVFLLPLFLWVICSYMVSAVMYGEGKWKSVFIGGAYMLSPYLVFMPVVNILSYVLTYNERFIVSFGTVLIWGYVLLLLYFSVKEINNYSASRSVGAILITLFFMVVVVVTFSIVYMLCRELIEMVLAIIKEVSYRV